MKYVLVVDVPEPMESDDVRIDYYAYYHCADSIKSGNGCRMKPLPKTKDDNYGLDHYANGWNDCLEEVTGETDEK